MGLFTEYGIKASGGGSVPIPAGIYLIGSISGNRGTSSVNYTADITNSIGGAFTGEAGAIWVRYQVGSSYTSDLQIASIDAFGVYNNAEQNYSNFKTVSSYTYANDVSSAKSQGLVDVSWGTNTGRFNVYGGSGTPSRNTGLSGSQLGSDPFLYAETSSTHTYPYIWLKFPNQTLNGTSFQATLGMYGATIGTATFYVEVY